MIRDKIEDRILFLILCIQKTFEEIKYTHIYKILLRIHTYIKFATYKIINTCLFYKLIFIVI